MQARNMTFNLKGIGALFEQQIEPLLSTLALSPEGSKNFRRLVISEALDLVSPCDVTTVRMLTEYEVPFNIFESYINPNAHSLIFQLQNNVIKGLVCIIATQVRSQLLYVNALSPSPAVYYRSSITWDIIIIGIEEYNHEEMRLTLDQLNLSNTGAMPQ